MPDNLTGQRRASRLGKGSTEANYSAIITDKRNFCNFFFIQYKQQIVTLKLFKKMFAKNNYKLK